MKFYCTAGRGTEIFVAEELKRVFGQNIKITSTDGKSYFVVNDCGHDVKQKLMSLKTVERVFVEVLHENFQKSDRRGLLTLLHTRLNNKDIWEDCISTLKQLSISSQLYLQGAPVEDKKDSKVALVSAVDKALENKGSVPDVGTDINIAQTGTGTTVSEVGTTVSEVGTTVSEVGTTVSEVGTTVSDVGTDASFSHTASELKMPDDIGTDLLKISNKRRMSEVGTSISVSQTDTDIRVPEIDTSIMEQAPSSNSLAAIKNISVANESAPVAKRRKLDDTVTFRVSCRFSGFARKQLNIQRTSQQMGVLISKLLGWKIDLRHPKYEINIHLSDDTFTVGIPVTNIPLSKRSYIKHCGLRTPIAWIMASLLDICPGDVILDPMCGSGTILIEASQICQNAVYIGMDNDISQINLAAENVIYNSRRNCCMSLLHGDVRHIPLPDSSVNGVVTDAPFGQNHVVIGDLHKFYCQMLSELSRVVKPGGKIVLLTSSNMELFMTEVCAQTASYTSTQVEPRPHVASIEGEKAQKEGETMHSLCNTTPQAREEVPEINRCENSVKISKYSNDIEWVASTAHLCCTVKARYNVKLGETEGCIFVMQNCEKLKDC